MQPEKVISTIATGTNFNAVLFRIAVAYAETGRDVWFITPEALSKDLRYLMPNEKDILQLITFLYLKDYKDLTKNLTGIHDWNKTPSMIILNSLEHYCNFAFESYSPTQAAFVCSTLLNSAAMCSRKIQNKVHLIVACPKVSDEANYLNRIQIIRDLYFNKHIHMENEDTFFNDITTMCINNN